MLKKLLLTTVISALFLMPSTPAMAMKTISKEEWFAKLKTSTPEIMCNSFRSNSGINKQLIEANISPEQCITYMPASFDRCKKQLEVQIPNALDQEAADAWGKKLGSCISTDFSLNHFVPTTTFQPGADSSHPVKPAP